MNYNTIDDNPNHEREIMEQPQQLEPPNPEPNPQIQINLNENSNFLAIYFFLYFFTIVAQFGIAGIIFILTNKKKDLTNLALFGIILNSWKILYNFFYLIFYGKKLPNFKSVYIFEIILYTGNVIGFLGYYLYFSGKIDNTEIYYFCIPLILMTFFRSIFGTCLKCPFLPSPIGYFIESIFILIVALKFGGFVNLSWNIVLLVWYISAGILIFACFIMILIFLFFLCANNGDQIIYVFSFLICTFCYFTISFFNVIHGFQIFLENQKYSLLYGNGFFMAIGSFIILLVFTCIFITFIHMINNYVNINQAESISLTKFAKKVSLGMKPVSGHYFKKQNLNISDSQKNIIKLEECTICFDRQGDVLIKPCGHSGICKDCILECLKNNILCPICKNEIKEVLVLEYDEEKKEYMANANIQFKKK